MEITTVEGYILSKLFEAEARAENLEAELIAKTQQAEAGMRSIQTLKQAILRHKGDINRAKTGPEDHELWSVLDAPTEHSLIEENPEMSEPTVEMPADYWEKP